MSSEEVSQSLSNDKSENDELNFKDDEEEESNKFKVPENNSEKKSESLNFKDDEEKESNKFKVPENNSEKKSENLNFKEDEEKESNQFKLSQHSQSKKSDNNKSQSQKSKSQKSDNKNSQSRNSQSQKNEDNKSESQKSQSQKSQSKKNEDNKSDNNKSQSQKSQSKKNEDNKSESQKSQSQKSESQKSKSQKSQSKKSENKNSENKNSESKKSSLPKINTSNNIIDENKSEKSIKNNNLPLFNDILTGDPNDENLNLPPLTYNNKYIKTPSEISKTSSKHSSKHSSKLKLNNENEEKKSEYSKSSKFKKSKKSNYEEKKSETNFPIDKKDKVRIFESDNIKSSKKKIINDETIIKEPPHENSIDPYRIQFNNEEDKNKINDLLCYQCQNFPLNPISCSECNTIFCKECIDSYNKCLNCNSIFKQGEILDEIKNLYSNIKIKCKYKECGCDEILSSNDLLNHENNCKLKLGKCTFCNNEFKYEELYSHIKNCKNNERKCTICGYKDTYEEYNKTDKKIEHIKHILLPDISNIIKSEMNKFYKQLFEEKEQKKKLESKGDEQIDIMKTQGEKIINLENIINEISDNIKKIQSSPSHNAVGLSIANNELKNKLKSIKLINNISNSIDNGFECDNKFCIIQTFTNDYIIVYPNVKYGIDIYNLSNNQIENVIKKAHDSNITCMSYSQNKKKNLTYLITASFDRSINIYSIEDGWKIIKNYKEAHDDYSIFSLDSFYNENNGIISISGNKNLSEIKVWFCDNEDNNNNKIIKLNNNIFCIKHNPNNLDEIYIGTDEGILLFLISKISENQNNPEKNLQDKNYDKSNHICISFLDNNEYNLIEGDSIGKIRIWSLNTNELIKIFERGILTFQINTLDNWDDRFVIGGSRDGKIVLFDIIDGVQVNEIGSHNGYVYCVKIATHWKYGKIIVSSGFDGVLKLWGSTDNN